MQLLKDLLRDRPKIDRLPARFDAAKARELQQGVDKLVHLQRTLVGIPNVFPAFALEFIAAQFVENPEIAADHCQGRPQIVSYRIVERLQFPIGLLQFVGSRCQVGIQPLDLLFHPLAFVDVVPQQVLAAPAPQGRPDDRHQRVHPHRPFDEGHVPGEL